MTDINNDLNSPSPYLENLQKQVEAPVKKTKRRGVFKPKERKNKRNFEFSDEVLEALNQQVNYYGKNQSATVSLIILRNRKLIETEEMNFEKIKDMDFTELLTKQANIIAGLEKKLDTNIKKTEEDFEKLKKVFNETLKEQRRKFDSIISLIHPTLTKEQKEKVKESYDESGSFTGYKIKV